MSDENCVVVYVRIGNTFELWTRNPRMKTVSLAAESQEDRQTWLVKLARVSNHVTYHHCTCTATSTSTTGVAVPSVAVGGSVV